MRHEGFDGLIHRPRILLVPRAVTVVNKDRVAGVEHPLHAWHGLRHALDVAWAHSTPVHAVLMDHG